MWRRRPVLAAMAMLLAVAALAAAAAGAAPARPRQLTVGRLRLRGVRFVTDVTVTGSATWNTATGEVTARVRLSGPRGTTAELGMSWNDLGRHPRAIVTGQAGGALLAATLPAP